MTKKEVSDALFSLDYVQGQLKTYGEKNDYDHRLLLAHLSDVVKSIEKDRDEQKEQ